MKQYIAILFIFTLVSTSLFSDGNLENEELMTKKWDQLWDIYDSVGYFSDGLVLVEKGVNCKAILAESGDLLI